MAVDDEIQSRGFLEKWVLIEAYDMGNKTPQPIFCFKRQRVAISSGEGGGRVFKV